MGLFIVHGGGPVEPVFAERLGNQQMTHRQGECDGQDQDDQQRTDMPVVRLDPVVGVVIMGCCHKWMLDSARRPFVPVFMIKLIGYEIRRRNSSRQIYGIWHKISRPGPRSPESGPPRR